jgi:hypothetical protein
MILLDMVILYFVDIKIFDHNYENTSYKEDVFEIK